MERPTGADHFGLPCPTLLSLAEACQAPTDASHGLSLEQGAET